MLRLYKIAEQIEEAVKEILCLDVVHWKKQDASPVTNIDLEIQDAIITIIRSLYPHDSILCEEEDGLYSNSSSLYSWVIDPIDGTHNFISNRKEFSISVGLMRGNMFEEALLIFPALEESYYAGKGIGIWRNGSPFNPGNTMPGNNRIILCSKTIGSLKPAFEERGYSVECYRCATYSLLMVLQRKALLYHTINTRLYDVGPMSFIVSESGIESFNRHNKMLRFKNDLEPIPFFCSVAGSSIPDDLYEILIAR